MASNGIKIDAVVIRSTFLEEENAVFPTNKTLSYQLPVVLNVMYAMNVK